VRRIGTWTAAIALGAVVLAGCGGDDSSDASGDDTAGGSGGDSSYCEELVGFQDILESSDPAAGLEGFGDAADALADEAPDEVSGEWEQIRDAYDQLESKLEEAGLSLEDLSDPTALQNADPQAMATLQEDLSTIGEDVQTAGQTISEHAQTECDIDLGGAGGETDAPSDEPTESTESEPAE
jgi:predicted small secreted protein